MSCRNKVSNTERLGQKRKVMRQRVQGQGGGVTGEEYKIGRAMEMENGTVGEADRNGKDVGYESMNV